MKYSRTCIVSRRNQVEEKEEGDPFEIHYLPCRNMPGTCKSLRNLHSNLIKV